MVEFTSYAGRVYDWKGQLTGLPSWARTVVGLFAVPGLVLAALSLLALLVSILALLVLTLPVYAVLRKLTTANTSGPEGAVVYSPADEGTSPGAKRVESTVVE